MNTTDQLNTELEELEENTQDGKFLTFTLGKEEYGIEIRNVTEIIGIQNITDLPDMPNYIKGIINLRGKVIPVMDVRLRFGMEERAYDERTCIVVVNIRNSSVGLIVDSVSEVVDIAAENIEPPPLVRPGQSSRYVEGLGHVENAVKILLDIRNLLYEGELDSITDTIENAVEA